MTTELWPDGLPASGEQYFRSTAGTGPPLTLPTKGIITLTKQTLDRVNAPAPEDGAGAPVIDEDLKNQVSHLINEWGAPDHMIAEEFADESAGEFAERLICLIRFGYLPERKRDVD